MRFFSLLREQDGWRRVVPDPIAYIDATIPPFRESDSAVIVRSPVVAMPTEGRYVEGLLQRCSFAGYVKRVKVA